MITNFKTYQIISRILKNNLVFAITATVTAVSTLLSSILYLCHELTLAEWNISPSLVDNPYSNNGIQIFIIGIVICILFLILQTLFTSILQHMIDLIKTLILLNNYHIDAKHLKLTKLIFISFLKTVTSAIIYVLFLIFCPTLLLPHQNHTIPTLNIQFVLIYCILMPTLFLILFPSKIREKLRHKIGSSDKEQATGKQKISATFFSKAIQESHQLQSSASEKNNRHDVNITSDIHCSIFINSRASVSTCKKSFLDYWDERKSIYRTVRLKRNRHSKRGQRLKW